MPIYVYAVKEGAEGCAKCQAGFEALETLRAKPQTVCPDCGAPIERVPVAPALGRSQAALDDRAKAAGFSKLKRIGKGEYERQY